MRKPLSVCLIFGGRSAEHEVSITSAQAIYQNLDKKKYQVGSIYITKEGSWKVISSPLAPAGELNGPGFSFLPGHQTASGQD